MNRNFLALVCLIGITTAVHANEPQQPPEKLPAPKIVQPAPIVVESNSPRVGSIEVWQHYGVNRLGRFVPRVIVMPEGGAYYSRDLQPFPWTAHRSTAMMPYAE